MTRATGGSASAVRGKLGGGGAKRAYWAIASQALDSACNFFLSVWVARAVTPHEFGAFGALYVGYQIAALVSRAASNMPMMIVFSTSERRFSRQVAGDTLGASLASAFAFSAVMAIFGATQHGSLQAVSFAMAGALPGLLLQDCVCYLFIARQRPQLAVVNNAVWLGSQVVLFLVATYAFHEHRAWLYVVLWGVAAWLSVFVSLASLRALPALGRVRHWFRAHRSAIMDLSAEAALNQAGQQGVVYVIGLGVNLVGIAALRAAQVPLGLLRVFFNGLMPIGITEGARLYKRRPRQLVLFIRAWAAGAVLLNLAVGLLLIAMPLRWGRIFLGESWNEAHPIIIWVTIATAGNAAVNSVQAGLRTLAATRTAVKLRVPLVILQLGGALIGVVTGDLTGGVAGFAIGAATGAVFALFVFDRTFHRVTAERQAAAGGGGAVGPVDPAEPQASVSADELRPHVPRHAAELDGP